MYMNQFPIMNVFIMCCKHMLIKITKKEYISKSKHFQKRKAQITSTNTQNDLKRMAKRKPLNRNKMINKEIQNIRKKEHRKKNMSKNEAFSYVDFSLKIMSVVKVAKIVAQLDVILNVHKGNT